MQKQTTLAEISSLVQNNDLSGCAELAEDYKRICLNNVYFNLAKSSLDKKDCDNISAPELKVSCYAEVDKGLVIKKQQNISNAEKTEEENFRKNDAYQKITAYKDGKTAIQSVKISRVVYNIDKPFAGSTIGIATRLRHSNCARNVRPCLVKFTRHLIVGKNMVIKITALISTTLHDEPRRATVNN